MDVKKEFLNHQFAWDDVNVSLLNQWNKFDKPVPEIYQMVVGGIGGICPFLVWTLKWMELRHGDGGGNAQYI